MISRAALWPRPGVLHVASCSGRVVTCFPYSRIVSLDMPDSGLQRLSQRLSGSFQRDAQPKAAALGPGLYGDSRFYPSREKFYLLKTPAGVAPSRSLFALGLHGSGRSRAAAPGLRADKTAKDVRRES